MTGAVPATEHVFTLNPAGITVTHADAFGDGTPLCGFIGDDEKATGDLSGVYCRDCQAAIPAPAAAPCTRSFPGCPESVSAARSWVAGFFAAPSAPDAALMTSELVTNAIVHSASGLPGGSVTVTVAAGEETVRVDVIDQGAVPAAPSHGNQRGNNTPVRSLGKGLAIVAQLADVFGADGCDRWFALRAGGAA
jgi:anti-sigma regulatory factor (Ser/Thr protein kinase)